MAVNVKILFEYPQYFPYFPEERVVICDSEGNRKIVLRSKLDEAVKIGKVVLVSFFDAADNLKLYKQFESHITRQRLSGRIIDEFRVIDGKVWLTRVHLRTGTYTIPEFVHGIFFDNGDSPFIEAVDLTLYNASPITNFNSLFSGCHNLVHLDLSHFDTSKAENMAGMFASCDALEELDVSGLETAGVLSMQDMFCGCSKLKSLNLRNFNTSQVAVMTSMFCDCSSLFELDLSSFDVRKVFSMSGMFYQDYLLHRLDLSSFKNNRCCEMVGMFGCCRSLEELNMQNMPILRRANVSNIFKGCPNVNKFRLCSSLKSRVLGPEDWNKMWIGTSIWY